MGISPHDPYSVGVQHSFSISITTVGAFWEHGCDFAGLITLPTHDLHVLHLRR